MLALGAAFVVLVGAFVATAQTPAPEEDLPLAPVLRRSRHQPLP